MYECPRHFDVRPWRPKCATQALPDLAFLSRLLSEEEKKRDCRQITIGYVARSCCGRPLNVTMVVEASNWPFFLVFKKCVISYHWRNFKWYITSFLNGSCIMVLFKIAFYHFISRKIGRKCKQYLSIRSATLWWRMDMIWVYVIISNIVS